MGLPTFLSNFGLDFCWRDLGSNKLGFLMQRSKTGLYPKGNYRILDKSGIIDTEVYAGWSHAEMVAEFDRLSLERANEMMSVHREASSLTKRGHTLNVV